MIVVPTPKQNRRKVMTKYSTAKLDALTPCDGYVFELDSVLAMLMKLDDVRKARGKVYVLATVLLMMLLAKLSGEDSQRGMAQWLAERKTELAILLALPKERTPCRTTLRRIVTEVISVEQLEKCFGEFIQQLATRGTQVILSLDGKTLRGSVDLSRPRGMHLLAAYLPEQGLVLWQMDVERKENEIPVAKRLLKRLDLRKKIITGDALLTQRKLCLQIVDAGGEYVFKVKDNQPQLHDDIRRLFTDVPPKPDFERVETVDGTHGRLDKRTLTVSSLLHDYSDWPHLAQVFQVVRRVTDPQTGSTTEETSYGVTSLTRKEVAPMRLLQIVRGHWGIENSLHYRRDVTFHEDHSRVRLKHAPQVMAALNNLVLSLFAWLGYENIPQARRHIDAHWERGVTLLTRTLR
jgi:predicted transposase YbfD/YdcC